MLMRHEKGQSTVEYAIIIAVVISALLVMQFWMRRGVMGKLRDSTDSIGDQFNPFEAKADLTKNFNSTRTEALSTNGTVATSAIDENQSETGTKTEADKLNSSTLF